MSGKSQIHAPEFHSVSQDIIQFFEKFVKFGKYVAAETARLTHLGVFMTPASRSDGAILNPLGLSVSRGMRHALHVSEYGCCRAW